LPARPWEFLFHDPAGAAPPRVGMPQLAST
jgi:hypothetical protein